MTKQFNVVIPARMHSTRLPHKMVLDVGGIPLIIRTAKQALKSKAYKVTVATDHADILKVCHEHQVEAIMTSATHNSGTDRLAEVANILNLNDDEVIVNVQGDEPLINPLLVDQLAEFIFAKQTAIATVAHPIMDAEEIFNPNVVKVVLDHSNNALYFSRAAIPYSRDCFTNRHEFKLPQELNILRHVGMYAYNVKFLKQYNQMQPSALEQVECLEQLRALYNGYKIAVLTSDSIPEAGVDTLEDLQRIRQIVANTKHPHAK